MAGVVALEPRARLLQSLNSGPRLLVGALAVTIPLIAASWLEWVVCWLLEHGFEIT